MFVQIIKTYFSSVIPTLVGVLGFVFQMFLSSEKLVDHSNLFFALLILSSGLLISLCMVLYRANKENKNKITEYEKEIAKLETDKNDVETNRDGLIQINDDLEKDIEYKSNEINRIYIQWVHLGQLLAGAVANQKNAKFQTLYTSYITCSNILNIDIKKYIGEYYENVQNSEDN